MKFRKSENPDKSSCLIEDSAYVADYLLFKTKKDAEDYLEREILILKIGQEKSFQNLRKLSANQIRIIKAIIENPGKPAKTFVECRGGMVQNVYATKTCANIETAVADWDCYEDNKDVSKVCDEFQEMLEQNKLTKIW